MRLPDDLGRGDAEDETEYGGLGGERRLELSVEGG